MTITKVKFFRADNQFELQQAVNEFICYRDIVNISYNTYEAGYNVIRHCACVTYREG